MDAYGWHADRRTKGGDAAAHNPLAHLDRTDGMGAKYTAIRRRHHR